ncbi:MAG TPA: FlgD immunoglobulin-like domain containing protein, partial [Candidatus Krumholzibacteriaceae bacterium]
NPPFAEPLPICEYTMGQVGLRDNNDNSIPDIYEISPVITFMTFPGVQMDTLLPGEEYILSATVTNGAVPNNNPQEDTTYMTRISYAPYIKSGEMSLNGQPFVALTPVGGKWDSPNEQIGMGMAATDFLPGSNAIVVKVQNRVEMSAQSTKNVFVIGLKYYHVSSAVRDTSIRIEWTTAADVFGAVFDVVRTDLTAKGSAESIGSVSVPDGIGDRRAYSFIDAHVKAGHEYRYRVVGRFSVTLHGEHHSYEFPSQDIDETALVPIKAGFISNLLPNPTPDHTTFTVNVPRSYRDMSGSLVPAGGAVRLAPSDIEVRTRVDINVYNALGQRIKSIYSNSRFGGIMTLAWDGTDTNGRTVPTGVYFLRVDAGGKKDVKKVVILR